MQVNIALLTVTDTRTIDTDKSGAILVKKIEEQNHKLVDRKIVKDEKKEEDKKRERGALFRDGPRIKWEEGGKKWFTTGDEKTQGKYEGEILDGVPHGQGTYYWFNVNRYEGGWEYGLFDGQGTYYSYPSGVKVVGEFRRDKEWNTFRYDKDGNIIEKIVRGKLKKD